MNRRLMLAASVATLGTVSAVLAHRLAEQDGKLEVRTTSKKGEIPFSIEEFDDSKKSQGVIRCEDEKGLTLFLKRTFKDRTAPNDLHIIILDGSTLAHVTMAAQACWEAGYSRVQLSGCIPPGCGITAGATKDQKRLDREPTDTRTLIKTLQLHSTFC